MSPPEDREPARETSAEKPAEPPAAGLLQAMVKAEGLLLEHRAFASELEQVLKSTEQTAASSAHLAAQVRSLVARGRDLRVPTDAVREAIDRTRIIALNAGLEGSRLPENEGRALLTVGEDIRNVAVQADGALDELWSLLSQIDGDRQTLADNAERTSDQLRVQNERIERLYRQQARMAEDQARLVSDLSSAAGADPALARLAVQASDQVQGLLTTLLELARQSGSHSALGAFRSQVTPLVDLLERVCPRGTEPEQR